MPDPRSPCKHAQQLSALLNGSCRFVTLFSQKRRAAYLWHILRHILLRLQSTQLN